MATKDRRLINEAANQALNSFVPSPLILLQAIHQARGCGWHVWIEGSKLIVTEMDLRWRRRFTLTPLSGETNIWRVRFAADVSVAERRTWITWLAQNWLGRWDFAQADMEAHAGSPF